MPTPALTPAVALTSDPDMLAVFLEQRIVAYDLKQGRVRSALSAAFRRFRACFVLHLITLRDSHFMQITLLGCLLGSKLHLPHDLSPEWATRMQ